jgi:glycosyltransferase involved in cell wall biosynthesis
MGAGIVASDLEQIGEVLSPALRTDGLDRPVTDERAVLCQPGDVAQFVEAVVFLVKYPETAAKLGTNARRAAETYYSWEQHVRNFWSFLARGAADGYTRDLALKRSPTTS